MSVIAIPLVTQSDLTPLTDWFSSNPDVTIVSINLEGGTFYIFYK